MTIRIRLHTADFRYLWLKTVTGFDPAVHCARGLLGAYSRLIPFRGAGAGFTLDAPLDLGGAPYVYLCGVAGRYADNLHLPMEPAPGEEVCYQDARITVAVSDARLLPIPELPPDVAASLTAPFHRCRNYRFGWHYLHRPRGGSAPAGRVSAPTSDTISEHKEL